MLHQISRRGFMKLGAAVGVAGAMGPLVLTSRTRGAAAPNGQIALGFIGMGVQNRSHLAAFLKNDQTRVLAVCDVDTTRRDDAKKRVDDTYQNTDCTAYIDHRELLARKDIDAVVIGSPDHWHAIQVIDACAAGKDIYCEKPLCLTLYECRVMIEAVRKHDRVFQTGTQQRTEYGGKFRTACEYVRNGRLGRLQAITVSVGVSSKWCDLPEEPMEPGLDWDRWLGPAPVRPYNSILSPRGVNTHYPQWRLYREYSGGKLTDWGAHHFDIVQWGLDMDQAGPVEVLPPKLENDQYGAELIYANGVRVIHGGPGGVTFLGEKGLIFVSRDRLECLPDSILKEPLKEEDVRLPRAPNHHADWLACIRDRRRAICDVEVGARSIACAHLANVAYWYKTNATWDPATWTFKNPAHNSWLDYERRAGYELPKV